MRAGEIECPVTAAAVHHEDLGTPLTKRLKHRKRIDDCRSLSEDRHEDREPNHPLASHGMHVPIRLQQARTRICSCPRFRSSSPAAVSSVTNFGSERRTSKHTIRVLLFDLKFLNKITAGDT